MSDDEEVAEVEMNDSDKEEELIEIARRKRQAIMERFKSESTPTSSPAPAVVLPPGSAPAPAPARPAAHRESSLSVVSTVPGGAQDSPLPLATTAATAAINVDVLLAAAPPAAAATAAAAASNGGKSTPGGADSPPPAETFGAADMFSDQFAVGEMAVAPPRAPGSDTGADENGEHLTENWDDEDGYYKLKIGESLGGRYAVFGYTGQGVFSNVVRARDEQRDNSLVAIKIIRNNTIMLKAAQKELAILQQLDEADKIGRFHCVKLLDHFMHRGHMCLVFEHFSMNLRELQRKFGLTDGLSIKVHPSLSHNTLPYPRLIT